MYLPKVRFSYTLLSWVLISSGLLIALCATPRTALGKVGGIQTATFSARVTATVIENFFTNPVLTHPYNGSVTNNPLEIFSWNEATSTGGMDHYFFYFDGQIIFDHIPNNATSYSTDTYHITHNDGIFTLQFMSPPSEGYHTWQVDGVTRTDKVLPSETWQYLLDTTNPIIILTTVDKNNLYWASNDPQSIPITDSRNFIINQDSVLLKGKYEANSNLKISIICQNTTGNCPNDSILINNSDGNWEHIFRYLRPNQIYTVYMTAVDSAGNITNFPPYTILYKPFKPIEIIVSIIQHVRPKPTPTPTSTPIEPEITPTPVAQLTPLPPVSPTPPPLITPTPAPAGPTLSQKLGWLSVWGLVAHLSLLSFGLGIGILSIWKFLWRVFWPWVKGGVEATSWSTFTYYDANNVSRPTTIDFAAVSGNFRYITHLPDSLFLKITKPGYQEVKLLTSPAQLPKQIMLPHDDQPDIWTQVKLASFHLRVLPLLIAIFTSTLALLLSHEWYYGICLYFSLHFGFTEYVSMYIKPSQAH